MLILGITDNTQGSPVGLTLSVSQQVVAGIFIYYYILVALIIVVVVVIIIGVAVFIFRRKRRNNDQSIVPAAPQPAYNNIEYLQNFMPAFPAEQLGG
jgi:heme/copper-type cytochrome/quinol oxidase subunit 2